MTFGELRRVETPRRSWRSTAVRDVAQLFTTHSGGLRPVVGALFILVFVLGLLLGNAAHADQSGESKSRGDGHYEVPPEVDDVEALLRNGALLDARQKADQINNGRYRVMALGYVAQALAAAGRMREAEEIAATLNRGFQRDWIFREIVAGSIHHNYTSNIYETLIFKIDSPTDRISALCFVSYKYYINNTVNISKYFIDLAREELSLLISLVDDSAARGIISAYYDKIGSHDDSARILSALDSYPHSSFLRSLASLTSQAMMEFMEDFDARPQTARPSGGHSDQ
jgi:hypothetical protein